MKKQKVRKLSLRTKILLPTGLLILAVCLVNGLISYQQIKTSMIKMGVEAADMASAVALRSANGNALSVLSPGSESSENYQSLLKNLRNIQESCGIKYLYTLYTDGQQLYYGVDTDQSQNQKKIGDVFEFPYEEFASVFSGENYVQNYIDSSNGEHLISTYKPIYSMSGNVVAILGCDYNAEGVVEKLNVAKKSTFVISAACLAVSLSILCIIASAMTQSLHIIKGKIYDLVHNEGDLTQKLNMKTGDEMELISDNINALLEHILKIMIQISSNSDRLNTSSKIIASNLGEAKINIADVSATMEEMSAAMEETSASLFQVNESIFHVDHAAGAISERACKEKDSSNQIMKNAAAIYEEAVGHQQEAKILAREIARSVNEKIEESKNVSKISDLTTDIINITQQTNLLSLNASIEAARAGEAGRGFAVVADEIGKLASNSANAAAEIRKVSTDVIQAVNELAAESEAMVKFMEETAMGGYEKLLDTSENYRKDVKNMNSMMEEFAMESQQLRASMNGMKESISAIHIAIEESTTGITSVTEMAVDLTARVGDIEKEADANKDIAGLLDTEVHKFKLE